MKLFHSSVEGTQHGLKGLVVFILVCLLLAIHSAAGVSILNYNISGIGDPNSESREALQRIVDYFDPDIIIFQEGKGLTNLLDFFVDNNDYEAFYSSADGAGNRRVIMAKESTYDIIDSSVREYSLGEGSLRTLFAATIDIPGPKDLEVFTAHWHASSAAVRDNESAASVAIIQDYRENHPYSLYIYTGDLNDEDTSYRITNLLDPNVGLNLFTPVDLNNDSNATINSDPNKGTYISRRIDYILPSETALWFYINGKVLNTWTYTPETIPAGLTLSDTIDASDHLPVYMNLTAPGDMDNDNDVDFIDYAIFAPHWFEQDCNYPTWCEGTDLDYSGRVDFNDLAIFTESWLWPNSGG